MRSQSPLESRCDLPKIAAGTARVVEAKLSDRQSYLALIAFCLLASASYLALLVYAVGQRRLRQQLARQNETVPNQINQPTQRPTLRWIFQLLDGIHRIRVTVQGRVHDFIEGLNDVKLKVLRLFGEGVCRLYQISPG